MFFIIYLAFILVVIVFYLKKKRNTHLKSVSVLEEAVESGLTEPVSMHPVIDTDQCIGCGSCVKACPESHHHVLGLINGKAALTSPTECIGHGACKAACPVDAITLVFGTARRGVDLPVVKPTFETNVDGLYVAGELGGMGLIKNALTQGREAVENISKNCVRGQNQYDLIIVGGGPSGLGAAFTAISEKLNYVVIEQDSLGGTVFKYPRRKLVMTQPVTMPVLGKIHFRNTTKEELLGYWSEQSQRHNLNLKFNERVESVVKDGTGFTVKTTIGTYRATNVLLSIGRRGSPRTLGVPGEELSKVVYRLIDPEQYKGAHVLVVGGGDSALEAAASVAEADNTNRVTLSYRGTAFQRAKPANRQRVEAAVKQGNLEVILNSNVQQIGEDHVILQIGKEDLRILENNAIIVNAGGILPDAFLKKCGIKVVTKWGTE
jgi:thioredoxin reductase (NADPH)